MDVSPYRVARTGLREAQVAMYGALEDSRKALLSGDLRELLNICDDIRALGEAIALRALAMAESLRRDNVYTVDRVIADTMKNHLSNRPR